MPGEPAGPRSKTVLIVDDDDAVLTLMEHLIKREGFQVVLARTGDEAMVLLKRGKPDAIVLDLMLPGTVSGFKLLNLLQALPPPLPPVIVVTAYSHPKEAQDLKNHPCVAEFFAKPVDAPQLVGALHRLIAA